MLGCLLWNCLSQQKTETTCCPWMEDFFPVAHSQAEALHTVKWKEEVLWSLHCSGVKNRRGWGVKSGFLSASYAQRNWQMHGKQWLLSDTLAKVKEYRQHHNLQRQVMSKFTSSTSRSHVRHLSCCGHDTWPRGHTEYSQHISPWVWGQDNSEWPNPEAFM
jgi:hypothetical protein